MNKLLVAAVLVVSIGAALVAGQSTTIGSTVIVVNPANPNGWAFVQETPTGSGAFVIGPATPPLGVGSASLQVNSTGGMALGTLNHTNVRLDEIDDLEYSTFQPVSSPGTAILSPSLQLQVDYDLTDVNTSFQGRLVFEPYLSGSPVKGSWQTWDPLSGVWWASGAPGNATCPMSSPCTWAQVLAAFPDAGTHASIGAVLLKAGGGWSTGFQGNVDAFTISVNGNATTYDFELPAPCTTDCYVRPDGNDLNGGTADTPGDAKKTIQAAIDTVQAGGTVHVAAGTYDENVIIHKSLTLTGAGAGSTVVRPAVTGTGCTSGVGSLCAGSSSVLLVRASGVEISNLTVDGDNTTLTSGVVVGGADIDARNGIIEDHTSGVFNNTHVHDVTVQNIYLRGIQAGSGGNGFSIHDNHVQNVRGEAASIAIFNFGGSGTFADNTVDDANDGVVSNWSRGTTYTGNTVTNSSSGIHTDNNGGSGGVADVIDGNTVSDCSPGGYGIWTFAPYLNVTVQNNRVENCAVGLAASGDGGVPATTAFAYNVVDGEGLAGSTGVYVTTDRFEFGSTDVSATFTGNVVVNNADGFYVESQPGFTASVTANFNEISSNASTGASVAGTGAFDIDMRVNWWGDASGPAHTLNPDGTGNSVSDSMTYSPWLGLPDASATPGFQLASPMTWVAGPAVCDTTCVQAAVDFASNGDTVVMTADVFNEPININKSISLVGAQAGIDPRPACAPATESVQRRAIQVSANGVVIDGITIAEVGSDGVAPGPVGPANPDPLGTGIYVLSTTNGHQIRNNVLRHNIFGLYLHGNGGAPVVVERNCFVENNEPGSASGDGIYSDQGLTDAVIRDNRFTGHASAAMVFAGTQSLLDITGNALVNDNAIVLINADDVQVLGNTSVNPAGSAIFFGGGSDNVDVIGNTVTDGPTNGVRLTNAFAPAPNTDILIQNNILDGTGTASSYGVRVAPGGVSTGLVVTGNTLTDHQASVEVDGATAPVVSANNATAFTSSAVRLLNSAGSSVSANVITGAHLGSCIGGHWGIFAQNGSADITGNDVSGIGNGLASGCQEGRGIEATGATAVTISGNVVDTYQKSGIIVRGSGTSIITNNTTAGEGPSSVIAQNGITVVSTGATTIANNITGGHRFTSAVDPTASCGILYAPFGPTASAASIDTNTSLGGDENGICATDAFAGGTVSGVLIRDNRVFGHAQRAVDLDGMTGVLVNNTLIDGQGLGTTATPGTTPDDDLRYYGIYAVDTTGTISNNNITGIKHGLSNGLQSGVGIRVTARPGAASDVDITGNVITDVQKNAMVVTNFYGGTSVNADISGNTVTGNGPISYIAQNGIQVSNGATGTIVGNDVSGYHYTPFTWAAVGILLIDTQDVVVDNNDVHDLMEGLFLQDVENVTVTDNTFTNYVDVAIFTYLSNNGDYDGNVMLGSGANTYGLYVYDASSNNTFTNNQFRSNDYGAIIDYSGPGAPTGNVFTTNCIADNITAGMATTGPQVGGPVNAENNWWGKVNGPNPPGFGDAITPAATIDADPFLVAPVAGCPVPADGDGDGLDDPDDNCPVDYNPGQENTNGEPMPLPKPVPSWDDATNPAGDADGDACDPDIDGDGVLNGDEVSMGLSPYVWDTDGDRTNDGTEIACGSNPLSAVSNLSGTDSDSDRLPDTCETIYGTNPADNDSDDDGSLDGVEVRYWLSNPLVRNTDGDTCRDAREIASVDANRVVNAADLGLIAAAFGQLPPEFRPYDQDGNGVINAADLGLAASQFGGCP